VQQHKEKYIQTGEHTHTVIYLDDESNDDNEVAIK
jgi:hypothetical protein